MIKDSEPLNENPPSQELLAEWGAINYIWASLDTWVTGALASVLNADVVEVGILIGQLESVAKLKTICRLLKHRRDARVKEINTVINVVETLRPLRNAITHGHYLGSTSKKVVVFTIPTQFLIGDNPTASAMFVIYPSEATKHFERVVECIYKIIALFGFEKRHELLSLPNRVPSYSPPKPPRKRAEKKAEKKKMMSQTPSSIPAE